MDRTRESRPPANDGDWKKIVGYCAGAGVILALVATIFEAGEKWQDVNRSIGANKALLDELKQKVLSLTDEKEGCVARSLRDMHEIKDELLEKINQRTRAIVSTNTALTQIRNEIRVNEGDEGVISPLYASISRPLSHENGEVLDPPPIARLTKGEMNAVNALVQRNTDRSIDESFAAAVPDTDRSIDKSVVGAAPMVDKSAPAKASPIKTDF